MSKWHGGKGSAPRPYSVTQEEYDNRWDLIWGRDKLKPATEESSDTEEPVAHCEAGKDYCQQCLDEDKDLDEDTEDADSEDGE